MTARAVSDFLKTLLDGQKFGNFPPCSCVTELPQVAQAGTTPQLFIWCREGQESRISRPRLQGYKQGWHHVMIYFLIAFKSDSTVSIRDLTEGIMNAIRSPLLPVQGLIDPITGSLCDIVSMGENMTYMLDQPHVSANQRLTVYGGYVEDELLEFFKF